MGFGTFGTDGLRAEGLLQDYSAAHYIRVTIERETMLRFGGTKKLAWWVKNRRDKSHGIAMKTNV